MSWKSFLKWLRSIITFTSTPKTAPSNHQGTNCLKIDPPLIYGQIELPRERFKTYAERYAETQAMSDEEIYAAIKDRQAKFKACGVLYQVLNDRRSAARARKFDLTKPVHETNNPVRKRILANRGKQQ